MRTLHDQIFEHFRECAKNDDLGGESFESAISEKLPELLACISNGIASDMLKRAPKQLNLLRKQEEKFEKRNYNRWKAGFDRLLLIIEISMGLGSLLKEELGENFRSHKAQALISLHARGLVVSRECLALLKAGYADGALGRWRTLHEIATVATFLSKNEEGTSERYLAHRHVMSARAVASYIKHQERARLAPMNEEELRLASERKDDILKHYGSEMESEWGWAYPAIHKKRPNFSHLEEACELDHWRPRYKWASEETHGLFRPPQGLLALAEARDEVILAGASNSGMVDPCQMVAITTRLSAASLLSLSDSLDFAAMIQAMGIISDDIGPLMMRDENASFKKALKKHQRQR